MQRLVESILEISCSIRVPCDTNNEPSDDCLCPITWNLNGGDTHNQVVPLLPK